MNYSKRLAYELKPDVYDVCAENAPRGPFPGKSVYFFATGCVSGSNVMLPNEHTNQKYYHLHLTALFDSLSHPKPVAFHLYQILFL